jgi:hypothetical protein
MINGEGGSSVRQPMLIRSAQLASYGDPALHTVIQWHFSMCQECNTGSRPSIFGKRPDNLCPEYFEIIQEYAEYEGHYAMMGNP